MTRSINYFIVLALTVAACLGGCSHLDSTEPGGDQDEQTATRGGAVADDEPMELVDDLERPGVGLVSSLFRASGGGGLVSTMPDYYRFAQMLHNRGELDGVRLLGPRTVGLMTANHLPPELLPISMEEIPWPGFGFGLGFSVLIDRAQAGVLDSVGTYGWGGWASTNFWIDPQEELVGILMLQYIPSGAHPIREELRTLAYQAIAD